MNNLESKSILVRGKVQGVFYRASTVEKALELGVTGTVRNLSTGDVFVKVFGTIENVENLARWCTLGSQFAVVDSIEVIGIKFEKHDSFKIEH